jgi:Flp pilus assembly protein TadD
MGKRAESDDIDTLRRNVEWALRNARGADEVLPMLAKLARTAEPESDAWVLAHRHLAELAVDRDPWRSAIFARRVVRVDPEDDGAWAVLGLSQTLLGNYRYAVSAYRRAIALAPQNPWYGHNLGHLLDVALGRPSDALVLLADAYKREPKEAEIAASYAHALARAGKLAQAKKVLRRVVAKGATSEQMILWRWLEQGAPATRTSSKPSAPPPRPKTRKRARAEVP